MLWRWDSTVLTDKVRSVAMARDATARYEAEKARRGATPSA